MKNDGIKDSDKFIVGWIGSRSTSVYILNMLDIFDKLIKKYPNMHFNLIGFDKDLLKQVQIRNYNLNILPWIEKEEIRNILDMDIGIMPLTNDPWSKGKCGFKLIQYMSCKKPVIASSVGINCSIVKSGENGFLASTNEEWYKAIEKLYLDKGLRDKISQNNFEKILKDFNFDKNCEQYLKLLNTVVV